MGYQTLTIEEFNEKLQQWSGKKIKIVKHEAGDLDEIIIDLQAVNYSKEEPTIDDYEPTHSLHLNGAGLIETTTNNYESLPSDLYEIPLETDTLYEQDKNRLMISTSRAAYTIEPQE
ncbi:hypothetical protein [Oceanobacillus sp. CAU 1775]